MTLILASLLVMTNATPRELVANCRAMVPADVELSGRIVMRNRRGVVQAEHRYTLRRESSATSLSVDGKRVEPPAGDAGAILGTDVTWSDLSLEYLWWDDVDAA